MMSLCVSRYLAKLPLATLPRPRTTCTLEFFFFFSKLTGVGLVYLICGLARTVGVAEIPLLCLLGGCICGVQCDWLSIWRVELVLVHI